MDGTPSESTTPSEATTMRDRRRHVRHRPEGIVKHILARVSPGSIVLLHPWYASRQTSLAAIGAPRR